MNKKKKVAIVFLDELEAVATSAAEGTGVGTMDRREVRKVLLGWLDGIRDQKEEWQKIPVFMVGATNYKEVIDEALLRSGRMEEHVFLGEPTVAAIGTMLARKGNKTGLNFTAEMNWGRLANELAGVSGADIDTLFRKLYRRTIIRKKRYGNNAGGVVTEKDIFDLVPEIRNISHRIRREARNRFGFMGMMEENGK